MSLVRPDGAMELFDGVLRVRDADGAVVVDGVGDQHYLDLIEEQVKPWSYMKFPYLRQFGADAGTYRVGPLARVQNCDFIDTPLAEAARRDFVAHGHGRPIHAALAYHWARMIELLHAMELIARLLDDPDLRAGELMAAGLGQRFETRTGIGVIEAPRGTLIHHYEVGADDLVKRCNLIVSTTHNNQAMNEAVRAVARQYFDGREVSEGLLNHVEVAIRAYDPCLSCATHALGGMPLDISVVDAGGSVVDRLLKHGDGTLQRVV
jgi:NAD-reducing hydrogenase large subunit